MERYSFDKNGWFSENPIIGRQTTVAPPHSDPQKIVGMPYPNWTGIEWVLTPYYEPPIEVEPQKEKEVIVWTWGDLMELLTPKERKAIRRTAKTDEDVEDVVDMLKSSSFVKSSNKTENRLNLLAGKGCLTSERVMEILR